MPLIAFPNVPLYPGVPPLVRDANIPAAILVSLGSVQSLLANAIQNEVQWGIFDAQGNQLGLSASGESLFQGFGGPILSTNAFEFSKESSISDFQLERGSFASYNKVELPATPVVTLALAGTESDRTVFLNQIDAACKSTDLYSVVTPEVTYYNYSIARYNYMRRASSGASLLLVEISLQEIRQVSVSFSNVQTPINDPQNPAATPQTNSGLVQPQAPAQSTLKSITNLFPKLSGAN